MGRSRERLRAEIGSFLSMYGRGRSPGHGPNDRGDSREVEEAIKRLPPEELDRLMRDDEDDADRRGDRDPAVCAAQPALWGTCSGVSRPGLACTSENVQGLGGLALGRVCCGR